MCIFWHRCQDICSGHSPSLISTQHMYYQCSFTSEFQGEKSLISATMDSRVTAKVTKGLVSGLGRTRQGHQRLGFYVGTPYFASYAGPIGFIQVRSWPDKSERGLFLTAMSSIVSTWAYSRLVGLGMCYMEIGISTEVFPPRRLFGDSAPQNLRSIFHIYKVVSCFCSSFSHQYRQVPISSQRWNHSSHSLPGHMPCRAQFNLQKDHVSRLSFTPARRLVDTGLCLWLELPWLVWSKLLLRPFARDNLPILELESSRSNDQMLGTLRDTMTRESVG